MSAAQSTSQNPTWTEPPWSGWIETTGDALLILEAARRGLIPRVTRRLVDSERKMITSGSVFVFDEDESGIKRWTDGFFWSPSRILGNFLLYRETDKKGAGNRGVRPDPDTSEQSQYTLEGARLEGQTLSRPKTDSGLVGVNKQRERTLMGSLTNSYKFKPDGLMKKTFSLTIGGVSQHLISYYRIEDVENGRLRPPSSLPELASLDISPEYLDKTHFRNPPKVEIGADGRPRYRGEADDIDSSPSLLTAPLSTGLPLLTDGPRAPEGANANRRDRRYNPLSISPNVPKRARKSTKTSPTDLSPSTPTNAHISSPETPTSATVFPDPNAAPAPTPPTPHYPPPQAFFQMQPYPAPPPHPHMYSSSPYSTPPQPQPHSQSQSQSHSQPQQSHYNYGTYTSSDQGHQGRAPQSYYSYSSHPPPPGYAPWPHPHPQGHYQGYPPQPQHQHHQHHQNSQVHRESGKHDSGNGDHKT